MSNHIISMRNLLHDIKLNDSNFLKWQQNLKIVLIYEKKSFMFLISLSLKSLILMLIRQFVMPIWIIKRLMNKLVVSRRPLRFRICRSSMKILRLIQWYNNWNLCMTIARGMKDIRYLMSSITGRRIFSCILCNDVSH